MGVQIKGDLDVCMPEDLGQDLVILRTLFDEPGCKGSPERMTGERIHTGLLTDPADLPVHGVFPHDLPFSGAEKKGTERQQTFLLLLIGDGSADRFVKRDVPGAGIGLSRVSDHISAYLVPGDSLRDMDAVLLKIDIRSGERAELSDPQACLDHHLEVREIEGSGSRSKECFGFLFGKGPVFGLPGRSLCPPEMFDAHTGIPVQRLIFNGSIEDMG